MLGLLGVVARDHEFVDVLAAESHAGQHASAIAKIFICLMMFSSSSELLGCCVGGNREDVIGGQIRDYLLHQRR